ncbi:hypothetical protein GGI07_002047 [Coemansia sp. Benny D115]|nr:hypothetical protein GGI07_002047 [Coemansia sp. Benny D115]
MYEPSHNGAHSYSTPASPAPYNSSTQQSDGKAPYDRELAALFRATAANVTQLYKEASEIGNSAFKNGYEQCFSEVCEFISAAMQAEGTSAHADNHRLVMQQLAEFARDADAHESEPCKASEPSHNSTFNATESNSDALESLLSDGGVNGQDQPECSPGLAADEQAGVRVCQNLLRGKRLLEGFDHMDIEPPRRRQRKDDIEMI